ncbi:hypothetical protein GF323_01450 [Candidatus Woesearchaeota archaeon]|nr:hypothetical protein [Candidatus Woesearchaeota archaeon]
MSYRKTTIALWIALILAVAAAYGAFSADITPIKNRITLDENAEFSIEIKNTETYKQTFRIDGSPSYPDWSVRTMPIIRPITLEVPAKSNESINILIKPNRKYVTVGSYRVNIEVATQYGEEETILLQPKIGIISSDEIIKEYVPTVTAETNFPSEVNPSEKLKFRLTLENQNRLNMSMAKLIISSKLLEEEIELRLAPREEKVIDIEKDLDPKLKPFKDLLTVRMIYEGEEILGPYYRRYELVPYSRITEETDVQKSFLKTTKTVIFTNKGNIGFQGRLSVPTTHIKRFFGSTKPKAEVVRKGGMLAYSWEKSLRPYESFSVQVKTNYLSLLILVIIIIALAVFLYIKRSPIYIKKQVTEIDSQEGGISKAKILINVKNRSEKKISEIAVIDKIPKLLDVEKHTTLGSLKPKKIRKNKSHETLILWDIDELMPGEERVISYYVKSSLQILGGFTLQAVMAKFRERGQLRSIRSNRVFIRV